MKKIEPTFYILPGNPPPNFPYRKQYNASYAFYKKTWERLFNRPGRPKLYDPRGAYRQSYIFQLNDGDQVIAQTLATHYHLSNLITKDLPFFEGFLGKPEEYLLEKGAKSLLSFEYSSVHRDYSARKLEGLNLYKVIIQLCMNMAKTLDIDAVIGHPRRVTKTNDLIGETGCKCIVSGKDKYGVAVDIYVGLTKELKAYDDLAAMKMVSELWSQRTDTIGLSHESLKEYSSYFFKEKIKEQDDNFDRIGFQEAM